MTTTIATKLKLSPVNMDARKAIQMRAGDVVRVWVRIEEGKDKEMEKYVLFLEDVYKVDGTKYIIDNEDVNIPNSNK
jgi:hypothetical protein